MGRQSARLWFDGHDHKDIYFRGKYHDKMYVGNELVWEKLPSVSTSGILNVKNVKTVAFCNGYFYFLMTDGNFGWVNSADECFQIERPSSALLSWIVASRDHKHLYGRNYYYATNDVYVLVADEMVETDLEEYDVFAQDERVTVHDLVQSPYNASGAVLCAGTPMMSDPARCRQALLDVSFGTTKADVSTQIQTSYDSFNPVAAVERPEDVIQLGQKGDRDKDEWTQTLLASSFSTLYEIPVAGMSEDSKGGEWFNLQGGLGSTGMHGIYFVVNNQYLISVYGLVIAQAVSLESLGVSGEFLLASNENETRALCRVDGVAQVWMFPNAGSLEHTVIDTPDIGTPTGIAYANGYWFYGGSDRCVYTKG